ncbi:MAG: hypothetical protein WCK98_05550 [bacterium]
MTLSKELESIIRKESKDKKVHIKDFTDHFGDRSWQLPKFSVS